MFLLFPLSILLADNGAMEQEASEPREKSIFKSEIRDTESKTVHLCVQIHATIDKHAQQESALFFFSYTRMGSICICFSLKKCIFNSVAVLIEIRIFI